MALIIPAVNLATIACYLPTKKKRSFDIEALRDACSERGLQCLELLDAHGQSNVAAISQQNPRIFLHKLTDSLRSNDEELLTVVAELIQRNPNMLVIDPLPAVQHLLNRGAQYEVIRKCVQSMRGSGFDVSIPTYAIITDPKNSNAVRQALSDHHVTFPVICKPLDAHGIGAHNMSIMFDIGQLARLTGPFIAQSFINHSGRIFKIFAIGSEAVYSYERTSFPNLCDLVPLNRNFTGDAATVPEATRHDENVVFIQFDSANLDTARVLPLDVPLNEFCATNLMLHQRQPVKNKSACYNNNCVTDAQSLQKATVSNEIAKALVKIVIEHAGLTLFGVDVVIADETGDFNIVDLNIFPSYKEVTSLYADLAHLFENLLSDGESSISSSEESFAEHSS